MWPRRLRVMWYKLNNRNILKRLLLSFRRWLCQPTCCGAELLISIYVRCLLCLQGWKEITSEACCERMEAFVLYQGRAAYLSCADFCLPLSLCLEHTQMYWDTQRPILWKHSDFCPQLCGLEARPTRSACWILDFSTVWSSRDIWMEGKAQLSLQSPPSKPFLPPHLLATAVSLRL